MLRYNPANATSPRENVHYRGRPRERACILTDCEQSYKQCVAHGTLLFYGGVAELAYAGDLKSSAFGIVGSSPTASTMMKKPSDNGGLTCSPT